jgi:segregation and condensation protein A
LANYRVNLDVFSGPLDLLLYLIRKDEVDIYDISLTNITDQYLKYLDMLKTLDVELAGEFLVMAATLMHIKSTMLLPKDDVEALDDDDLSDPRTELIRQLLEYKKFKDAANLLKSSATEQSTRFARPNTIIENLKSDTEPEIDLETISVWDLLEAFDTIVQATGGAAMDFSHITDDTPIDLYQIEILHRLQTDGPMTFIKVFEGTPNRSVMVGLFLALLELIREKLIWAEQAEDNNEIYLKALTDEPAELMVMKAIADSMEALEDTSEEPAEDESRDLHPAEQIPIQQIESASKAQSPIETKANTADEQIPIAEIKAPQEPQSQHGDIPAQSQENTLEQ